MSTWILFPAIIAALAVLIGLLILGLSKGIKSQSLKLVAKYYTTDQIIMVDYLANCFGLQSAGVWQVRGNGGLVLTKDCLHFLMLLPNKEFRIPLKNITRMTITKSHLGEATPFDLLKVTFLNEGKEDSIAWLIKRPNDWISAIEQIRKHPST